MKNIVKFLKEAYDSNLISNVKVFFDVKPSEFYIDAPETYSESDIQIYLGDRLIPELPADNEKYSKLLGKNKDKINDVYFEYDKFEHLQKDTEIDEDKISLKWDAYYDEQSKDATLDIFKITNLHYIILFDEFEMLDDADDINEVLNGIFDAMNSNSMNKYPVEIEYNKELLEFTEE